MDESTVRKHFLRIAGVIVAELRLVSVRGDRARLCAQSVASVVLAVVLADIFHLKQRWWVALSAYVLIRASPVVVFRRCMERLAGTVLGAACGAIVATFVLHDFWPFTLALTLISGLGIYYMIGSRYAYSWVLGTVTALMVLSDPIRAASPTNLAINRILDVAVGVIATAIVCAASFSMERFFQSDGSLVDASTIKANDAYISSALPMVGRSRSTRIWQAVQGALAIAIIGLIDHYHALPNFAQSMVSVIAVLLVPLSVLMDGQVTEAVYTRMLNRLLGCLCAALFAAPLLPLIGNIPFLCLIVLGVGVWIAAHVQAGSPEVSYIGTQFGVGFIMIFVQDHAWSTDPSAALQRLMGIVAALFVLALVMAACSVARRVQVRQQPSGL
jgi:uncharacterized membrane protein YccC